MTYGYCRCSTDESRQDTERQARELMAAGAELIVQEYAHGTSEAKREQDKLFQTVQPGDTIVVTEISRLSRSTKQFCNLLETIESKRIRLQVLNSITVDCRAGEPDPMSKAFLQMGAVFAELERSMICSRVKSGMANAKAKGTRSGRPVGRPTATAEDVPAAFTKVLPLYQTGEINVSQLAMLAGCSRPTAYKYLGLLGVSADA